MICPYCKIGIQFNPSSKAYPNSKNYSNSGEGFAIAHGLCPNCEQLIVIIKYGTYEFVEDEGELTSQTKEEILYPRLLDRASDNNIPEKYRNTFNEAYAVLSLSPKASAALSRRLLQTILRDEYTIKKGNLETEIEAFFKLPNIPSEIREAVDAVRQVGNFAAHPMKSQNTGEIVDVEIGEAEWLLEVIEQLFQITFIDPAKENDRKNKLNKKLNEIGKPQLKK